MNPFSQIKENNSIETTVSSPSSKTSSTKEFLGAIGPGLITGASDDDPSGIATYSMAGAKFGFSMLWTAPLFLPLVSCVEYTCAKIAMVTGTGLAGVMKRHYSRSLLIFSVSLLVIANTINVGTDIGAIAAATNLLVPQIPALLLVPAYGMLILALQIFGSYRVLSALFKMFTLSLLSYFFCVFFVKIDFDAVLKSTFIPAVQLNSDSLMMLVALLGTTISPYCFFWQASEEVEEEMKIGRKEIFDRLGATDDELRAARFDVDFGMLVSVLVMYFIMLTTGATLHAAGIWQIDTAADAAIALKPLAGNAASLIFALGIIGTGFLAIPVLTDSAAYAVAESFGKVPSLNQKPEQQKIFYAVIAVSILIGMAINFVGFNPIQALFFTAVVNGILAPPLLIVIMHIANNKMIMGNRINGPIANFFGWATVTIMTLASALLLWFSIVDSCTRT